MKAVPFAKPNGSKMRQLGEVLDATAGPGEG